MATRKGTAHADAHQKKEALLTALAESGNVSEACNQAGVPRRTAYHWRSKEPGFAEAWAKAAAIGVEALEDEARRRAFRGWEEPVFYQGNATGAVRRFSDVLLIFLLKGAKPEKYRDNVTADVNSRDLTSERELTDTERTSRVAALLARHAIARAQQDADAGGVDTLTGE